MFDARPDRAREAIRNIVQTGRGALDELRHLLGGVRGEAATYAPQPGLARLDELADRVRAAGLDVGVTVEGTPRPLPAAVDLSAYRVVRVVRGGAGGRRRVHGVGAVPARRSDVSIRVLVADDQPLVRSGFRMVLDERPDLELVGEAADGDEAIRLASELDPDVILMEVRMPNLDGVEATRRLVADGTRARILVLTTLERGARGAALSQR